MLGFFVSVYKINLTQKKRYKICLVVEFSSIKVEQ